MRNLTRNGEELAHVTQTYLETIADQGAIYAEVSNSFREGADFDAQMEAVAEGIKHAQERTGIEARIVVTTLRDRGYEFAELAAKTLAMSGKWDAVVCLGVVVRGHTTHHEHIGREAAAGIASIGLDLGIPVMLGVLTVENLEQAVERSGGNLGNKGYDVAL